MPLGWRLGRAELSAFAAPPLLYQQERTPFGLSAQGSTSILQPPGIFGQGHPKQFGYLTQDVFLVSSIPDRGRDVDGPVGVEIGGKIG
jgi:hypothetical protein